MSMRNTRVAKSDKVDMRNIDTRTFYTNTNRRTNNMGMRDAIMEESRWGKTWNGADTLVTTDSACLDMFGRAGAMRSASVDDKELLFSKAFAEDPDIALKLLFYTRDVRGGYGERDTFNQMFRYLATINTASVVKNLWAVIEFGRAKDLYALIGTPAEDGMWQFIKDQFETDLRKMAEGESVTLLAKWIATPDSKSPKTKDLGKLTAKKLGYDYKNMREYKKKLRALRKYLDIPEAKMATGKWDEIEYCRCASRFMFTHRAAFKRHDLDRYTEFLDKVDSGEEKMNMGTVTPADIILKVRRDYTTDLETMWKSLPDFCNGNAMVICDTSGSMEDYGWETRSKVKTNIKPIDVAFGLALYFAQRNKGDLKDLMMNFSTEPMFIRLNGATLRDNYRIAAQAPVNYSSTDLEAAFKLLLKVCVKNNVKQEEMPEAILVISDMQINCVDGIRDGRMTFYDYMKDRYEEAGYKLPQVVFWNVNAVNPSFHAAKANNGVSFVSGFSPVVFKQVMENLGTTPYELMMAVVNSERYSEVRAY